MVQDRCFLRNGTLADGPADAFEGPDQPLQVGRTEAAQQLFMEIEDGLVEPPEPPPAPFGNLDVEDATIGFGLGLGGETMRNELIDDAGHGGGDLDHPLTDFRNRQGLCFAAEDAEHVVLGGRQVMLS